MKMKHFFILALLLGLSFSIISRSQMEHVVAADPAAQLEKERAAKLVAAKALQTEVSTSSKN